MSGLEWLTESQLIKLRMEYDSLIFYLRQRRQGKRRYKSLILKRIAHLRNWLDVIEESVREEEPQTKQESEAR